MKGAFFSADFVRDENDNLRLIEVNTDTGIVKSQSDVFDWTDFISVLSTNNIDTIDVIYKDSIQAPIVQHLSSSLAASASFITSFNPIVVSEDTIFPPSPSDAENKFILRMAYDELALLDSEYAKGTLGLLKLFVDSGDSGSVINFAHSSSVHGNYNTINSTLNNPSNVADFLTKTVVEEHTAHKFYKVGHSDSASVDRLSDFILENNDSNIIVQQYHFSPTAIEENDNKVSSIRTFQIVYGPSLDICYCAEYEILSIFELPTSLTIDDSKITNFLPSKHYYQFATNHIKNLRHGFLGDTEMIDVTGSYVEIRNAVVGDEFQSYFVANAPNTDDYNELAQWSSPGSTLPSGSYLTSSILIGSFNEETYTNEVTLLTFSNGDELFLGGETRLLVYDSIEDVIWYERAVEIANDDFLLRSNGELVQVVSAETVILEEPVEIYALNLEDVDNFILKTYDLHGFSMGVFFVVAHNCFVKDTMITLADGKLKPIQQMEAGDSVLSFNLETGENEAKEIISLVHTKGKDFVKYTFSNDTEIVATPEHPFYIDDYKIAAYNVDDAKEIHKLIGIDVEQIKIGDSVYLETQGKVTITNISILPKEENDTYIIQVPDNNNFYANGILVHNK